MAILPANSAQARARSTAAQVRVMRSLGTASRRRRVPRQATTKPLERDYARHLEAIVEAVERQVAQLLDELPQLVESVAREQARLDELCASVGARSVRLDVGEARRVQALLERAREAVRKSFPSARLEQLGEQLASQTARFGSEQLDRQVKAALGVTVLQRNAGLARLTENFVGTNVALMRDLPGKLLGDIEREVLLGFQRGSTSAAIATRLQERVGIAKKRARLIARDQIGTLNGQLNAARQRGLGITRFVWRTVGDERVRDEHEARNGQVYEYANPPDGELPGEPINCRCYAEPVVSDILQEV